MRIALHEREHLENAFTLFKNPVHAVEELIGKIRGEIAGRGSSDEGSTRRGLRFK
jgi:hypothetical protein